jgi:dTDP-glucose 4,6-dehydratase
VYGDGLQVRDWLHVADHCAAIALALTKGVSGEVYNIGGNGETTNMHIVRSLCALVDQQLTSDPVYRGLYPDSPIFQGKQATALISHVRDRQGHDRRYAINFGKAEAELRYRPSRNLAAGLKSTVQWYLDGSDWWLSLNRAAAV